MISYSTHHHGACFLLLCTKQEQSLAIGGSAYLCALKVDVHIGDSLACVCVVHFAHDDGLLGE